MNGLLKSAFALSLMFTLSSAVAQTEGIDDFLGLESEVLPELKGPQRFTPEGYVEKPEFTAKEQETILDKEPLKGQDYSIIPWRGIDPEKFLDITTWLLQRDQKDKSADWQLRLRELRHTELVGKVLKCTGTCSLYRGIDSVRPQFLSRVREGDELTTDETGSVWVYLMDGTLLRLSSNTSVSFHEINFSPKVVLHVLRLNHGHIFWHPRGQDPLSADFSPETDGGATPLLIREANQEHFERARYQKQTDSERLFEIVDLEEGAVMEQFKKINELKELHNPKLTAGHRVMLVAPNATVVAGSVSFDMVHVPGDKTYFKRRGTNETQEFNLHLRGYTATETTPITTEAWQEVEPLGRSSAAIENVPGPLQVTELLTRRIKTLELARELWVEKFTVPVLTDLADPKRLGIEHGYTLWGDDLEKRFNFLAEYTRRVETTNLRSQANMMARLERDGEGKKYDLNSSLYQSSVNHYLNGLKKRYTDKKMLLRETTDLQYYVWILKNGNNPKAKTDTR